MTTIEPKWFVVANVREGRSYFSPGTKVWCAPYALRGSCGADSMFVTGRSRGGRWISVYLLQKHLTNWRAKLCYEPALTKGTIGRIEWAHAHWEKDEAEAWAAKKNKEEQKATEKTPSCAT